MLGSFFFEFFLSVAFFFLVLSIAVSAVVEWVNRLAAVRPWLLRRWLWHLDRLYGPKIAKHPAISCLLDTRGDYPSYIDPTAFASATIQVVSKGVWDRARSTTDGVPEATKQIDQAAQALSKQGAPTDDFASFAEMFSKQASTRATPDQAFAQLYNRVLEKWQGLARSEFVEEPDARDKNLKNWFVWTWWRIRSSPRSSTSNVKRSAQGSDLLRQLLALWSPLDSLPGAHAAVGEWYIDAQERVSGIFKRIVKVELFVCGFAIAYVIHADGGDILKTLWRSAAITVARKDVDDSSSGVPLKGANGQVQTGTPKKNMFSEKAGERKTASGNLSPDARAKQAEAARKKAEAALAAVKKPPYPPLPLGWRGRAWSSAKSPEIMGFLGTALAVSMGATFWFDLLAKLLKINLRQSGEAPSDDAKSLFERAETMGKP